jgi:Zn finger protein HypA/HybF involved in hydrogenase expression
VLFRKIIDITWISSLSLIIKKGGEQMQAYCMKCRAKKEMKDARSITMKNGRPATQGVCPACGTKMFRIGKG